MNNAEISVKSSSTCIPLFCQSSFAAVYVPLKKKKKKIWPDGAFELHLDKKKKKKRKKVEVEEEEEEEVEMASCRRHLITALLLVVGCLLGFCVGIREKKGIYEELKEGVKHIAEDVELLKKDIVEDTNELKERMERTPVGKAEELREVAGIPKAHETAHEVRRMDQFDPTIGNRIYPSFMIYVNNTYLASAG